MQQNNLDLFEAYIAEREGAKLAVVEGGFAIYKHLDGLVYLQDIYVMPELRKSGVGSKLLKVVENYAKSANINILVGSTDTSAANATISALATLHSGFKISHIDGPVIWYRKEI